MRNRTLTLSIAGLVIAALALSALSVIKILDFQSDGAFIKETILDDENYSVFSTELDLLNFMRSLDRYELDQKLSNLEEVQLKFDVLWSRLDVVQSGSRSALLAEVKDGIETVNELKNFLVEHEEKLFNQETLEESEVSVMIQKLTKLRSRLHNAIIQSSHQRNIYLSNLSDGMQKLVSQASLYVLAYAVVSLLIIGLLVASRRQVMSMNSMLEQRVSDRTQDLQKALKEVQDSINYASRIQTSILPDQTAFDALIKDYFVIWEPRDKVGGDFYWCRIWGDGLLIILADCTGHGVPGAFMTLISTGALDRAQEEVNHGETDQLVQRMHQYIQLTLGQNAKNGVSDDGLELGACYLNFETNILKFTGARFSLFSCSEGLVQEIKGDKKGIGYKTIPYTQGFAKHTINLKPETAFYMTSDGLIDQIGGPRCRAYGKKRFMSVLSDIHHDTMSKQKECILSELKNYQGDELRRDDLTVIGFKPI